MESWFRSCWIHLWMVIILFKNISVDPTSPPRYTVNFTKVSFNRALEECSPGVLTTLATDQEVANILGLISTSVSPLIQTNFTFWVGLRKVKNECVVHTRPLRGFKWMEDGSEETQVSRWTEEPERTCTTVFCAALMAELDGSTVTRWGLIPDSCKHSYPFICKLRDRLTEGKPKPPTPVTPESEPATQETKPADVEPPKASEPVLRSDLCQHPIITSARSITLDPDNSSRIQVECWSKIQMELHCSGHPAVWRLLDDSPANFTTICWPCEDGFQKDAAGNCVDIDECSGSGAPCRYTCLNTEGSYKCVCSDENGKHQDEGSSVCVDTPINDDKSLLSGILIPVLVAVAALLVLVLVVAVIVRCCLMRRSKKRAMKKAEKMAMKSKEG